MPASLLADVVLVFHFAFVLFVVVGGLLVLRRPRLAWIHVPVAIWGALIELFGWVCPLAPQRLLQRRERAKPATRAASSSITSHR